MAATLSTHGCSNLDNIGGGRWGNLSSKYITNHDCGVLIEEHSNGNAKDSITFIKR